MKKLSNFVVALTTLIAPFALLPSTTSATTKNVQVNSNIAIRVMFGSRTETHTDGSEEVIGASESEFTTADSRNIDESLLKFVSIEPDFFANVKLTSIKINNETQAIPTPNGVNIYTLPTADEYVVDITGTSSINYNINWSNPGYTNPNTENDVKIINGAARVVKVYDNATNMNDISATIDCVANGCVDDTTKEGFIHFEKGNVIVFEFVPQYGYQLTSVNMNGMPLTPQDSINQYVLDTSNASGHGHFNATFTKTNDAVKTNSSAVSSGVLDLSSGAIDAGTGRLSVDDFTPSAEQTTKFANTASGYEIADYFDLNMQQIFHKGTDNDSDVWSNDLSQLAADANISLVLTDDINGNDIAVIHEKNDGTYELIPGTYDATSHTISFATDSFSNYAIAYRTVNTPETGASTFEINGSSDSIITAAIITFGSIIAFYIISRKYRKEQ